MRWLARAESSPAEIAGRGPRGKAPTTPAARLAPRLRALVPCAATGAFYGGVAGSLFAAAVTLPAAPWAALIYAGFGLLFGGIAGALAGTALPFVRGLRGWGLAGLLGGLAAGAPGAYIVLLILMNQGFVSPWWPLQLALLVGPPALGIGLALTVGRGVCSRRSRLPGVRRLTLALETAGALPALPGHRTPHQDGRSYVLPSHAPTGRGDEPAP